MNEHNIDLELEMLLDDIPEQEENFEKKIDKYIRKKIKLITLKTILVVVIIAALVFLLISPAVDAVFLNPAKLQKDKTYESVLRDYYDVVKPYVQIGDVSVKKKGFGRYEIGLFVADWRKTTHIVGENVHMDVEFGKYKNVFDPSMYLTKIMYSLNKPTPMDEQKKLIEEFKELPESARISLLIYDKNIREIAELRKEAVTLDWVEVYHPNNPDFQGGINLYRTMAYDKTDLREDLTEAELLDVYRANLKNLVEHPEIWEPLGLSRRSMMWPDERTKMQECYEDSKTLTNLRTQYYYVTGSPQEIVDYMEKTEIINVFVHGVKSSKWE